MGSPRLDHLSILDFLKSRTLIASLGVDVDWLSTLGKYLSGAVQMLAMVMIISCCRAEPVVCFCSCPINGRVYPPQQPCDLGRSGIGWMVENAQRVQGCSLCPFLS